MNSRKQATTIAAAILLATTALTQTRSRTPTPKPDPTPTGPTILIDTTRGRITCKLFSRQAPNTAANFVALATGAKDWTDPATNTLTHGKPFYDATAVYGVSDGIAGGDRLGMNKGLAGPPFPTEKSGLAFDRPGRLVMAKAPAANLADKTAPAMISSSAFYILQHADAEYNKRGGTVFGQCDDASIPVITAISHEALTVDNHPPQPIAINRILVLKDGETPPPPAPDVDLTRVVPQPAPMPTSLIPSPEPTGLTATIETTKGTLTCRLFKDETPLATANFIGLANGTKDWRSPATKALMHGKRFYDGLSFRRVIPDFMVQQADMPGDPGGDGDLGFHFANEIVPGLSFDRPGRLAYANAGPNTNQSEWFITEHPMHRLDDKYTIFGQCTDASVRIVESIARVPRDDHNRPLTPITIKRITFK